MRVRRTRQNVVFAISWLTCAAFYLCRKNFSVIMPILSRQMGLSNATLGEMVFGFSAAYAVGQFSMGILADLVGARWTVPAGMVVSAVSVATMGFHPEVSWLIGLQIANGLAQATGWSGLSRIFRSSFPAESRGITMGWWSACCVAGSFLATMVATFAATGPWFQHLGWRRAMWLPSILMLAVSLLFIRVFGARASRPEPNAPSEGLMYIRGVLSSGTIRLLAAAYFLVKFIRYSLLFWLPLFLSQYHRLEAGAAGYVSGLFDIAGLGGVIGAGYLSDRVFSSRRFPVASMMMIALAGVSLLATSTSANMFITALTVAFMGALTYGPDTLLVGAATQDASSETNAGAAAGIVDGFGSLGQLASPLVVSAIVFYSGWPALFVAIAIAALAAGCITAVGRPSESVDARLHGTAGLAAVTQSK